MSLDTREALVLAIIIPIISALVIPLPFALAPNLAIWARTKIVPVSHLYSMTELQNESLLCRFPNLRESNRYSELDPETREVATTHRIMSYVDRFFQESDY